MTKEAHFRRDIFKVGSVLPVWHLFVETLSIHHTPQRPAVEQKELANKWNEMGTDEPGLKTLARGLALSNLSL